MVKGCSGSGGTLSGELKIECFVNNLISEEIVFRLRTSQRMRDRFFFKDILSREGVAFQVNLYFFALR